MARSRIHDFVTSRRSSPESIFFVHRTQHRVAPPNALISMAFRESGNRTGADRSPPSASPVHNWLTARALRRHPHPRPLIELPGESLEFVRDLDRIGRGTVERPHGLRQPLQLALGVSS